MEIRFGEVNEFLESFTVKAHIEKLDDNIYLLNKENGIEEMFSLETILELYATYLEKLNNKKIFILYYFERGNKNHFYGYNRSKWSTMEVLGKSLPVTYTSVSKDLPALCRDKNVIRMRSFFENDSVETEFSIREEVLDVAQRSPYEELFYRESKQKKIKKNIESAYADIVKAVYEIIEVTISNMNRIISYQLENEK